MVGDHREQMEGGEVRLVEAVVGRLLVQGVEEDRGVEVRLR